MTVDLTEQIELELRRTVALLLWQLGAVRINLTDPFRLVSGNYSPIYVNCRRLISSATFSDLLAAAARVILERAQVGFDCIAGGETAGIPFAAFLARAFALPMVYVRKGEKAHGIASRVEGVLPKEAQVLLVEDLITDAGSKLGFIRALKAAGASVQNVLVVFDRQQGGAEALVQDGISLHAITTMDMAIAVAEQTGLLTGQELQAVSTYLRSPSDWHVEQSLPYQE